MNARGKWTLVAALLLPALMGASCSTNAVAESAATTFFDTIAESLVNAIFDQLAGGAE